MKRTADFYVLLEARGMAKAAATAVRMSRPATSSQQIAVRVRLTLPENAFAIWTPLVEAEVNAAQVVPPTAEVVEPEPAPESDGDEAAA